MTCPKCKKGKLFSVPAPDEFMKESQACDNMDCDYHYIDGGTPEEWAKHNNHLSQWRDN
jgi:uncharacterized protein (DUF983 family)